MRARQNCLVSKGICAFQEPHLCGHHRNKVLQKGFTLIELMIAVVVIAILAAIAYPSYQDSVRKSRRADAKSALMEHAQFMERTYI
jgi:prepilin-type N-terminal cleavage/methylation domain-containing protein